MALDATIPIDGDGVTTGVRVSELAGSIRTLRTDINTILGGYDTGWIARSDWTNVHMGSSTTKNADSNVNHGLDAPLSDLLVVIMLSSDGTDANSIDITRAHWTVDTGGGGTNNSGGMQLYADSSSEFHIQTGAQIVGYTLSEASGAVASIDTEDWFYKIKVWKMA